MKKFSISEAVKFGWNTWKANWKFFLGLVLITFVVSYIPSFLNSMVKSSFSQNAQMIGTFGLIIGIVFWVINQLINIGVLRISLDLVDGKRPDYKTLYSQTNFLLRFLGGTILYGLIVTLGIVLLIIPGIIFGIKLQFYSYLIIDKGLGPVEALKKSWEMTKGVKMDLFLFGLTLMLVNFLGLLALVVGLFASIPTTMVAAAYVYRKLSPKV